MELCDITNWTHEDVIAMFARINRKGLQGQALSTVIRRITIIPADSRKDALRMEIWRAERTKQEGWGDLVYTPSESAQSDLRVLITPREIERGSY